LKETSSGDICLLVSTHEGVSGSVAFSSQIELEGQVGNCYFSMMRAGPRFFLQSRMNVALARSADT
jgi:hypothetical protein